MRRRAEIPLGLRLDLSEPLTRAEATKQDEAIERMTPYDEFPPSLRRLLSESPFDFNPARVVRDIEMYGLDRTVAKIHKSILINRRDFDRQRQQALEWARDRFRIGPRPKNEAPPGGWTVHNFNG